MGPFRGGHQSGGGSRGGRGGFRGRGRGGSRFGGPKLPSTLLSEADTAYGSGSGTRRSMTRKEQRAFDRKPHQAGPSRQAREVSHEEDEQSDEAPPPPKLSKKAQGKRPALEEDASQPAKKKKKLPELTLPGAAEDDVEDQEIEWLEWMLKKEKEKGKDDDLSDGLDDILDFADIIGPGGRGLQRDEEDDDDGESGSELDLEDGISDGEDSSDEDDDGSEGFDASAAEKDSDVSIADDVESSDEDESRSEDSAEKEWKGIDTVSSPQSTQLDTEVPATKYIPPHLRAAALAEKAAEDKDKIEARRKLERKAQGILNKLSEANIESLLGEIEQLYRDHSRNDVTTTLTTLILQMIGNKANLLDSFVVLYATLVGSLHRIVGLEFGAHFVNTLVTRHHELFSNPSISQEVEANLYETPDASKEALNLLTLIAELYNAGVIGSGLIYDLIRGFLATDSEEVLGEREVEALLKILRCSGAQLRSDDPASLKDIVGLVQDKAKGKESDMTTRARFMIETLVNVKNGKGKTGAGAEQSSDAAARMKKFLPSLGRKRRLMASEPLRVSLTDLLNADKKGKWWLVGAGWSGNPLVEHEERRPVQSAPEEDETEEKALYELARKQGMNTDVRRSVFVVLLTSEDYVHACDRMSHLKYTQVQQREFVRVTLHSCALEKQYNPYYTLVLNSLCAESYDHRFTLQYALWDFIRELGGPADKSIKRKSLNIAKAMAYIIARGSMDLTVFKGVEWTDLNPATNSFLATFLIHLILATQTVSPLFSLPKAFQPDAIDEEAIEEIFSKTLTDSKLASGFAIVMRMELGPKKLNKHVEQCGLSPRQRETILPGLSIGQSVVARGM